MYAHDCVFEHVTLVGLRGCWVGLEEQQKQGCACTFIRFFIQRMCVCVCVCVYVCVRERDGETERERERERECVCVCVCVQRTGEGERACELVRLEQREIGRAACRERVEISV